MTVKIDEPTGVNRNDTAANERERVGIVNSPLRGRPETASPGFLFACYGCSCAVL